MSDGLTDTRRDEERSSRHDKYLEALLDFLEHPSESKRKAVINTTLEVDDVPRGFSGGRTSLHHAANELMARLLHGDKDTWAKLLAGLAGSERFATFKAISPFAGTSLIFADYGVGFLTVSGDIEKFVTSLIRDGKGWKTYDGDKYLVALPPLEMKDAEVIWVGSGTNGITGPRKH